MWESNFKEQYENQIKGRENEFAKEILDHFDVLPEHVEVIYEG